MRVTSSIFIKQLISVLLFYCNPTSAQQFSPSFYNNTITLIDGTAKSMNEFNGKTVLFYVVTSAIPDFKRFKALDTLAKKCGQDLAIIIIPTSDYLRGDAWDKSKYSYSFSQSKSIWIADISRAKQVSGMQQNPLLKWLSSKEMNSHFNFEFTDQNRLLIVSQHGILSAHFLDDINFDHPVFQKAITNKR